MPAREGRGCPRQNGTFAVKQLRLNRLGTIVAANAVKLRDIALGMLSRGRPSAATLSRLESELQTSAGELKLARAELEREFLASSEALENLAGHGTRFVKVSEDLVSFATGRVSGSSLLFGSMKVLEVPLNFLDASRPKTQRILERLKQDSRRIDELINVQVELQQTVGPLKYIQTLFKIESAPLGGDVQTMFAALTKEIETLHDQVCELFTTRFQELRSVQRTLNQVVTELQSQTDILWQKISQEKAQTDHALQQLQKELAENQNRESSIGMLSKQVNQDIQQVVMGLQFQDIINQKIEHTFEALARIRGSMNSPGTGNAVAQACRLEAGQLQATRKELANAESTIKSGITRAMDHLINADSQCLTLAEFNNLTTSADGMVQVLFDTFATLREQIAAMVASTAKAFEQLRSVGGLAADLTTVVRDLSQRIHLIGLNAQIQAAQVSQGVGLEVLSARTSEISRATNQISEAVAQKLDQLVLDLGHDLKALEELNTEAIQKRDTLETEGGAAEQSLHQMRNGALDLLNQINGLLDSIRSESGNFVASIRYVDTGDKPLGDLEAKLLELAQVAEAMGGAGQLTGNLADQARNNYTMTSERKVYDQVVQGKQHTESAAEEYAVELFSDPVSEPRNSLANIDLTPAEAPVNPKASQPVSAPLPLPPPGLGNNVELF